MALSDGNRCHSPSSVTTSVAIHILTDGNGSTVGAPYKRIATSSDATLSTDAMAQRSQRCRARAPRCQPIRQRSAQSHNSSLTIFYLSLFYHAPIGIARRISIHYPYSSSSKLSITIHYPSLLDPIICQQHHQPGSLPVRSTTTSNAVQRRPATNIGTTNTGSAAPSAPSTRTTAHHHNDRSATAPT